MVLMLAVMLLLLVMGMPVAFAIAMSAAVYILSDADGPSNVVLAQQLVSGSNSFILLAVPFFMLSGELMNAGGVTRRLVRFAECAIGGVRGGLSYVVIIVNMIMAGVSGAAIADAAAVGSVMVPSMEKNGYPKGFAAAVNAAAATVGPVIPPSVGFIIYASLASVSVGKLFLAGAVPGIIMGLYMMIVCYFVAHKKKLPVGERTSLKKLGRAFREAFWALLMPVIILGGILTGIVTPTEAGVIAVGYGLFIGTVVYREIHIRDLPFLLAKTAKQSAVIMFIIACAKAFGWVLARENVPELLLAGFTSISDQGWVFLLILNAVIIALGCFMEGGSIMIILTPLLLPALAAYHVDRVHFGVVFQLNIMIGLLTPPVGMLLYVITGVSGVKMQDMLKELRPFLLALIVVLLLITFVPQITLLLPRLLG
jgi:C4-dicarboxylate transporter, DctM subunit